MNQDFLRTYESVRRRAGFRDLSGQVLIEVQGPDRVSFLHSMISHDVQALQPDHGRYSTFLTATGRMIADFHLYKIADRILIEVRADLADLLQESLEKFVIMDDVTFQRQPPAGIWIGLAGPDAPRLLRRFLSQEPPAGPLEIRTLVDPAGHVMHRPEWMIEGFRIRLHDPGADLRGWLQAEGVTEIPEAVAETLRIEALQPRFGVDMSEENNPLEARLHDAYSLTKGCYVGQEVVAKATHVGGVNRLLVGLAVEAESAPEPAAPIFAGDRKVGIITSTCQSPLLRAPLAMGYVRRAFAEEGKRVRIEAGAGSLSARVLLESPAAGWKP